VPRSQHRRVHLRKALFQRGTPSSFEGSARLLKFQPHCGVEKIAGNLMSYVVRYYPRNKRGTEKDNGKNDEDAKAQRLH